HPLKNAVERRAAGTARGTSGSETEIRLFSSSSPLVPLRFPDAHSRQCCNSRQVQSKRLKRPQPTSMPAGNAGDRDAFPGPTPGGSYSVFQKYLRSVNQKQARYKKVEASRVFVRSAA